MLYSQSGYKISLDNMWVYFIHFIHIAACVYIVCVCVCGWNYGWALITFVCNSVIEKFTFITTEHIHIYIVCISFEFIIENSEQQLLLFKIVRKKTIKRIQTQDFHFKNRYSGQTISIWISINGR